MNNKIEILKEELASAINIKVVMLTISSEIKDNILELNIKSNRLESLINETVEDILVIYSKRIEQLSTLIKEIDQELSNATRNN